MNIVEGFEFFWPQATQKGVSRVTELREATVRVYGQAQTVTMVEFSDDWNSRDTWKLSEIEDSLKRGFIAHFTIDVPRKARKKLQSLAAHFSTTLSPNDFESFMVDGRKANVGITSWSRHLVGVVDDQGHVIRKQSIIEQVVAHLIKYGRIARGQGE